MRREVVDGEDYRQNDCLLVFALGPIQLVQAIAHPDLFSAALSRPNCSCQHREIARFRLQVEQGDRIGLFDASRAVEDNC